MALTREEMEAKLQAVEDKLGDENRALVSDVLTEVRAGIGSVYKENDETNAKVEKLSQEKAELISTNATMYNNMVESLSLNQTRTGAARTTDTPDPESTTLSALLGD